MNAPRPQARWFMRLLVFVILLVLSIVSGVVIYSRSGVHVSSATTTDAR